MGAPPIKTGEGWLHVAQGDAHHRGRRCARCSMRSCATSRTRRAVIAAPAGYLLAAEGGEQVGDVSSGLSCAGAVARPTGEVLVYYASSETLYRTRPVTTVERLSTT